MSDLLSKRKSFVFLSLLCFSLADVRDGLGPFLGVYLQGEGWRPDRTSDPLLVYSAQGNGICGEGSFR